MILLKKQYLKETENMLQPFMDKKKTGNWFMVKPQNLDNLNSDFFRKAVSDSWVQILHSSLTMCLEPALAPFLGRVGFGSFIFQANHLTPALDSALHGSDCFQQHLKETHSHTDVLWIPSGCNQTSVFKPFCSSGTDI